MSEAFTVSLNHTGMRNLQHNHPTILLDVNFCQGALANKHWQEPNSF